MLAVNKRKKRVVLGMSGGVDSSVAAILLQKQGYDVIGVTMQLLPKEAEHDSACCNIDSIAQAKQVAHSLGIPHYTLNIRDTFKRHVIDYFVNEYVIGRTPNPCVECNRYIKFDALWEKARSLGADFVATGHYCKRTIHHKTGRYYFKKAKDVRKDQTYFLYMMTQETLKHTLFPLGDFEKSEIRQMALKWGLVNAKKSDSQEICFVTKHTYRQFIEDQLEVTPPQPGDIVDLDGTILGQHTGLHHYTIGQRKGLRLSSPTPLYVIKIDAVKNQLIVGQKGLLHTTQIVADQFSVVLDWRPIVGKTFDVKTRYQMMPFRATVTSLSNGRVMLDAHFPQSFITPGQSVVLYDKAFVIGGGIIC
jgi:tRNA-specific 2-thiouridylase